MATFKRESRYRGSTVTQVELEGELENYVLLRKPLNVPADTEDKYMTLDQGNQYRPDAISTQAYGDPNFGWAIMEVNNIRHFAELRLGLRLRIPPLSSVVDAIPASNDI
jgi:hypothetical protein